MGEVGCDWPDNCWSKFAGASLSSWAMNLAASSSAGCNDVGAAALVGVETTVEVSSASVVEAGGEDWSWLSWFCSNEPKFRPFDCGCLVACVRACAKIASNNCEGMPLLAELEPCWA